MNENTSSSDKAPCTHSVVAFDLCALCGLDLKSRGSSHSGSVNTSPLSDRYASVSMLHGMPQVKVNQMEAQRLGTLDKERLLKNQKLALIIDLDQTLVHTSVDRNIEQGIPDVYNFTFPGHNCLYHCRLRPYAREFLAHVSKFYELHVATMGTKEYASVVTKILDNENKLFSDRVISRDELFDPHSKAVRLKSVFPCGDEMVAIMDDRGDVWGHCPNLIHVKPYVFFAGTDDINAPPTSSHHHHNRSQRRHPPPPPHSHPPLPPSPPSNNSNSNNNNNNGNGDGNGDKNGESGNKGNGNEHTTGESNVTGSGNEPGGSNVTESGNEVPTTGESEVATVTARDDEDIKIESNQSDKVTGSEEDVLLPVIDAIGSISSSSSSSSSSDSSSSDDSSSEDETIPMEVESTTPNPKIDTPTTTPPTITTSTNAPFTNVPPTNDTPTNAPPTPAPLKINDPDQFLLHLKGILERIHTIFYNEYDKLPSHDKGSSPDLKVIIPKVRKSVFEGVYMLFTGVVPTNMDPHKSREWNTARAFGGTIHSSLITRSNSIKEQPYTTHVIVGKKDTDKYLKALKEPGLKIVTPSWFWDCAERWEHLDESLYKVTNDKEEKREGREEVEVEGKGKERISNIKTTLPQNKKKRSDKSTRTPPYKREEENEASTSTSVPLFERKFSVSSEELEKMEAEIDAELETDEEDEDNEDYIGSYIEPLQEEEDERRRTSFNAYLGLEEPVSENLIEEPSSIQHQQHQRKRKRNEVEDISSDSNSFGYNSNSDSEDDELAALLGIT